jgi:hypothetical protein
MENSRPRLYFAGEGACSTIYRCIEKTFGYGEDFPRGLNLPAKKEKIKPGSAWFLESLPENAGQGPEIFSQNGGGEGCM